MLPVNERNPLPAWQEFIAGHIVGDSLEGTVTSIVAFGAFVQVAPGVEGLLHESVWGDRPGLGRVIRVRITAIDANSRRMNLVPA